ncbi:MAG: nucleotidyl transferase AbiEii/AbiGii toxin family protein [Bacteroidales bacterium]|nr:nucleotidyl transferase AbiEii/AbiGii toxin family protein [Bacteroidales bacterium]
MQFSELEAFRLVGGTALSLQLSHRISVDIDLFTDAQFGSIDFSAIGEKLKKEFLFVETGTEHNIGFGKMYYIGDECEKPIKLDLFYTDNFVFPIVMKDNIRIADIREIAAMKLEVISRSGRKKDFWDLIELLEHFSLSELIDFFKQKYQYIDVEEVYKGITNFEQADNEIDPICIKGRYWELIKADIIELVTRLKIN